MNIAGKCLKRNMFTTYHCKSDMPTKVPLSALRSKYSMRYCTHICTKKTRRCNVQ